MKKMKGVAASVEYSRHTMYEDQRARFKHQSLMQDFQDLHKETVAMRNKLQMLKERKSTPVGRSPVFQKETQILDAEPIFKHTGETILAPPRNKVIEVNQI
ncbi:uncharacterized protein LOC120133993 [Hibiscus syriacus]|uniref:uncharacterized protein LOC120133993 n=1 Tax=Hibiscus syriacus TaxID=106335 RepID=UPI001924E69A|nr:uncharacterized protein LOC120133993 [Hibiscus syriacus]